MEPFECAKFTEIPFASRSFVVTPDGLVYVLVGELYLVPASVGIDITVMHPHDVAADTCSGYNLIARRCLPRGREHCILKDSNVLSLLGDDKTPLSLSSVVSSATRFKKTVYRAPVVIADCLAVDVLIGTRLLNEHPRSINVKSFQARLKGPHSVSEDREKGLGREALETTKVCSDAEAETRTCERWLQRVPCLHNPIHGPPGDD